MEQNLSSNLTDKQNISIVCEQYKILFEAINKLNETRENSNNFWIGANGIGASLLAYLMPNIGEKHKFFLFIVVIIIGIFFSLSWLSYLRTIKRSIEVRAKMLVKIEKSLPIPIFRTIFGFSEEEEGGQPAQVALTLKEMLVPSLFLAVYSLFAVLLYFYRQELTSFSFLPPT